MKWANTNLTRVINLAKIKAASNSSLEIVCLTSGGTLVSDVTKLRWTSSVVLTGRCTTAAYAAVDASQKPCKLTDVASPFMPSRYRLEILKGFGVHEAVQ